MRGFLANEVCSAPGPGADGVGAEMGTPKVNICKLNCITDVMTKEAWMAVVSPWGRVSCGGHECRAGRGCCGLGGQGTLLLGNGSVQS